MTEIQPVTTIDALYNNQGAPTGINIIDAVVERIKQTTTHSSTDIAKQLGVEARDLNGALRLLVGCTLKELLTEWRKRQTLDLLDQPDLTLEEVAQRCGYADARCFSEAFLRLHGITPLIYREGKFIHNGRYSFNQSAATKRQLLDVAKQLHER